MSNGRYNQRQGSNQNDQEIKKMKEIALTMAKEDDPAKYNKYCDEIKSYVESNMKKITMTQVRKIYNNIRDINEVMSLVKLRPMFMYIGARDKDTIGFVELLDLIVKSINIKDQLNSFKEFFKAIVAYKAYEGKKGGRR